jgi:arylamine N-acetyltransferase
MRSRRVDLLESIGGEEAARLFLRRPGVSVSGRGIGFLKDFAIHFSRLPYENISKIIRRAASTSVREAMRLPEEVVADHIERGFGGTCFSLTFVLERMLRHLGFDCYKVMADMKSGHNIHCLVVVREPEAEYLIDPGYALYQVIELPREGAVRVSCPHGTVEVAKSEEVYSLYTHDATGTKWRYRFRDEASGDREFEEHWAASFGKPALDNICLNKITPQGHLYFRKDYSRFTSPASTAKRRVKQDIERFIEEEFGIDGEWVSIAQRLLSERRKRSWEK